MDFRKELNSTSLTSLGGITNMSSGRGDRLVELGEASESSDEGESEVFRVTSSSVFLRSGSPTLNATSSLDMESISSMTNATLPSITSVSHELPARPIPCRSLVEANLALGKGLHEVAGLPYAVAIKEIDNVTLDLVRGQQLMDDVFRHLEQVSVGLQSIQKEADLLKAHCRSILPPAPRTSNFQPREKSSSVPD